MTTAQLLAMCVHQWHAYWHTSDPLVRRHCTTTFLRYLYRLTHNGPYDRWWLRHVFLPRHIGPRRWAGRMQS